MSIIMSHPILSIVAQIPVWLTAQVFTGTNPKINAYGKLTDIHVAVANNSFLTSIRCCMANYSNRAICRPRQSHPVLTTKDHLGVPLTNIGELDETFPTHIVDNNSTFTKILYRYNLQDLFHRYSIRSSASNL